MTATVVADDPNGPYGLRDGAVDTYGPPASSPTTTAALQAQDSIIDHRLFSSTAPSASLASDLPESEYVCLPLEDLHSPYEGPSPFGPVMRLRLPSVLPGYELWRPHIPGPSNIACSSDHRVQAAMAMAADRNPSGADSTTSPSRADVDSVDGKIQPLASPSDSSSSLTDDDGFTQTPSRRSCTVTPVVSPTLNTRPLFFDSQYFENGSSSSRIHDNVNLSVPTIPTGTATSIADTAPPAERDSSYAQFVGDILSSISDEDHRRIEQRALVVQKLAGTGPFAPVPFPVIPAAFPPNIQLSVVSFGSSVSLEPLDPV